MNKLLKTAILAAKTAGTHLSSSTHLQNITTYAKEHPHDIVTEFDQQAESIIIDIIHSRYPDHAILSEECGYMPGSEFCWVIDPIDGTTNFSRGFPQYCISIALKENNNDVVGVIYDPTRDELFTACKNQGAFLNNYPLQVSQRPHLNNSLIATGFPNKHLAELHTYLQTFAAIFPHTLGVRRAGSIALELAYIAAGRLDGLWEFHLQEWDIAAGKILVEEAGGLLKDLNGSNEFPQFGLIAGTPAIVHELTNYISPIIKMKPISSAQN